MENIFSNGLFPYHSLNLCCKKSENSLQMKTNWKRYIWHRDHLASKSRPLSLAEPRWSWINQHTLTGAPLHSIPCNTNDMHCNESYWPFYSTFCNAYCDPVQWNDQTSTHWICIPFQCNVILVIFSALQWINEHTPWHGNCKIFIQTSGTAANFLIFKEEKAVRVHWLH